MKQFKVGIQLYSVRDQIKNDFYGTLKALKQAGYDGVELSGNYDKSAEEIRAILDEFGLECISVNQRADSFLTDGEEAVAFRNVLGAKYSAISWHSIDDLKSDFEGSIDKFKKIADMLKQGGIRLAYHNHDFEFQKIDGEYILDKIYASMDGKLEGEVDTCWVHYAGVDPSEYILKYKGQMHLLHLKDFECENLAAGSIYALLGDNADTNTDRKALRREHGFRFKPLGQGRQDFARILAAAEEVGIEYVIYEQDESYEQDSLEAAVESRKYLMDTFGV